MIVALIGTPSPLTYLATNMLRAIVQVTCGEHDMIGVNSASPTFGPPGPSEIAAKRLAVVVASDMPRPDFVDFLLGGQGPDRFFAWSGWTRSPPS